MTWFCPIVLRLLGTIGYVSLGVSGSLGVTDKTAQLHIVAIDTVFHTRPAKDRVKFAK